MPPRPSKSARLAKRAEQGWVYSPEVDPSPPPLQPAWDPIAAFMAGEDDTIPQPGAFENGLDFSSPSETFESGSVFGVIGEEYGPALNWEYPVYPMIPPILSSGEMVSARIFSVANLAACFNLADQQNEEEGYPQRPLYGDVSLPDTLAQLVESVGGFCDSDGLRWDLYDPLSTSLAYARSARALWQGSTPARQTRNFWLPTSPTDRRFIFYLAQALDHYFRGQGVFLSVDTLVVKLFSGCTLDSSILQGYQLHLGDESLLKFFLSALPDSRGFYLRFSRGEGSAYLRTIRLPWDDPQPTDCFCSQSVQYVLYEILDWWNRERSMIGDQLGLKYRPVKSTAVGKATQLCVWKAGADSLTASCPDRMTMEDLLLFGGASSSCVYRSRGGRHSYTTGVARPFLTRRVLRAGLLS